jgi:hypothetical protein
MKFFSKVFVGMAMVACLGFTGCGGTDGGAKTTPPAKADAPKETGMNDNAGAGEMVLVSLQLPNMT